MAEQKETIILAAEDQTRPATKSANANIDSVEANALDATAAITGATAAAGKAVITISEKSKKAVDKLVEQSVRDSERATMSKVEQLEAIKSRRLAAIGKDNQAASNTVAAAYDKMIAQAKAAETATRKAADANVASQATAAASAAAVTVQAAAYDKAAEAAHRLAMAEALRSKTALVPAGASVAGIAQAKSQALENDLAKQQRIVAFLEGAGGAERGSPRLAAARSAIENIRQQLAALTPVAITAQKSIETLGTTVTLSAGEMTVMSAAALKQAAALQKLTDTANQAAVAKALLSKTALVPVGASPAGIAQARSQVLQNELAKQQRIVEFLEGRGAAERGSPRLAAARTAVEQIRIELAKLAQAATVAEKKMADFGQTVHLSGDPTEFLKTQKAMTQVAEASDRARTSIERTRAARGMQAVAVDTERAATGMERFARASKTFQSSASSLGQSLTIGVTAPLGLAAQASIGVAEKLDQIDKSISTILGSQALSKILQQELKAASQQPGSSLTFEGAASGFRRIVAARRDISLATDAVKEFGNALALAGGTEEDLQGVTLALTQILSKAKVSAEEINQIAERIPATRQLIQQAFGTADSEAIVKKGITPEMFVRGVVDQAKLLPRAPESLSSQLKNIREDLRQAMGIIGKDLAEYFVPILKTGAAALLSFAQAFSKLSPGMKSFTLTAAALAATLGPLLLALGGFARVATTVAQVLVVVQTAHARATTTAVANTAAVTAEARAYDALAASAGRAAAVQGGGTSTALVRTGATMVGAGSARAQELQNALNKQKTIESFLVGKGAAEGAPRLFAARTAIASIEAELSTLVPAARAATVAVEGMSGAMAAATAAGAAFLAIPLVGYLQGVGRAFGDLMQSTHSAIVFNTELGAKFDENGKQVQKFGDIVNSVSGTTEGGLVRTLMAAAREARDLASALAKDFFEPQRVGIKAWASIIGPTFDSLSERYNDFVDRVSKSNFAKDWLLPLKELIDAGKRRLTVEKLGEDAMRAAQTLGAKGDREQAERAGALEKRGEKDIKRMEEDAKLAARRAELTRDLRLELTKATTEAARAGKEISEVERVAADRAQERINMIEREGAAVGQLQKKLFDLATTQKLLEAERKNTFAGMAEATAFRDQAVEKELTGLKKIAEQRRQAVSKLEARNLSSADKAKAMGLIDEGTVALTDKYMDQLLKDATEFFNQSAKIAGEGFDKIEEQRKAWLEKVKDRPAAIAQVNAAILELERKLTVDLEREYAARASARELRGLDAQKDTYLRELELQNARQMEIETTFGHENMNRRIQLEQDRLAVERDFAERRLQMEVAAIEKRRDIAAAAAETDKQKADIRRRAGEDIEDAKQQTQIDLDAKRQQTAIRLEEIIRAENQKTFDAFKRGYDDVFDALILRTKSFKDVAKSLLTAAFITPFKEASGNIFAKFMTDIFGVKRTGAAGIQSKLELPNRLGDVQLVGGAVPVIIEGASQQAAKQIAAPTAGTLSRLGSLGGFLGGLGTLRGTPPFVPGGSVSTSIDYGGGKIPLGGTTYPGTPPFVPPGGGMGGGMTGAWKGMLGDITKLGNIGQGAGGAAAKGVGGLGGGLMLLGGGGLVAAGMYKGGWSGVGMTTAGGALIGAKFGGPIGALIGGAAGFAAGMIRKQFKGKDEQIIERVKSIYGVTIDKKFATDPIGAIVQSKYGGNLDVGLRSPEVRDLVNLYGRSTSQKYGLANRAFGVGLEQTGGVLSQYAARAEGLNVAYSGGSLGLSGPVDRLVTSTVGDQNGMAQTITVQSLQLLVNGQSAAAALSAGVVENPAAVAQATLTANRRGINRRENVSVQQTPGLLMS